MLLKWPQDQSDRILINQKINTFKSLSVFFWLINIEYGKATAKTLNNSYKKAEKFAMGSNGNPETQVLQ